MAVKLELYRVFQEVARMGNISAAAQNLYISQSAVSQSIKQLEEQLQVRLFSRSTRGVVLTSEGKMLLDYVSHGLGLIQCGEEKLAQSRQLLTGELIIGASDTVTKTYLVSRLEAFHQNYPAIQIRILNGTSQTTFEPNRSITRAEFAAIVTRALGLAAKDTKAFTDVPSSKWYAGYIGTANSSGIVNGVGSGKFNPDGTITRQEAAAMVARAAKLCGLDTAMDAAATKDMLAQFGDYRSVASWAKEPMAFCYSVNILDQSDLNIEPTKAILRCEIAQMLYNMLTAAELI